MVRERREAEEGSDPVWGGPRRIAWRTAPLYAADHELYRTTFSQHSGQLDLDISEYYGYGQ